MREFDILITTAPKDYNKLPFVIDSVRKNICGFDTIYCVSPTEIKRENKLEGVVYVLDSDFVSFDYSKLINKKRKGWYTQQFIKLFQWITNDNYLVIDSDAIILKPLSIFNRQGMPYFFLGEDQKHLPYFDFMRQMFGFGRTFDHSFINEIMFFKREYIIDMVNSIGMGVIDFMDKSIDLINKINHKTSSFSEYETYGNWIVENKPESYDFKVLKCKTMGKSSQYSITDIERLIKQYKKDYDKLSLHTWL
jgi:hypothetical protein